MAAKDFQTLNLTAANLTGNLVSDPGYVALTGTSDGGTVAITLTDDPLTGDNDALVSLPVQLPSFINPVTDAIIIAGTGWYIPAHRLTFTLSGGGGSEDVTIRWFPVHMPY